MKPPVPIATITGFIATIITANWLAARYGLIPLPPTPLLIPAGTPLAALAFIFRDRIQHATNPTTTRTRLGPVLAAITAGTAASIAMGLWLGSPIPTISAAQIAAASGAAFLLSELLDTGVYTPLQRRRPLTAMLASNTAGAALDTWLFLSWSGFGFTWPAFTGQVLTKALIVSPLAVAVVWWLDRRAVPRCAT